MVRSLCDVTIQSPLEPHIALHHSFSRTTCRDSILYATDHVFYRGTYFHRQKFILRYPKWTGLLTKINSTANASSVVHQIDTLFCQCNRRGRCRTLSKCIYERKHLRLREHRKVIQKYWHTCMNNQCMAKINVLVLCVWCTKQRIIWTRKKYK